MILNTGCRTDIPAFYSDWFLRRVQAGFVLTRNPYRPEQVLQYHLAPDVVDVLCFCTKNPAPMLPHMAQLRAFRQFWFVTLTPYGKEIEPFVPDKASVVQSIQRLSALLGRKAVCWRYDPIFLTEKYDIAFHLQVFARLAAALSGSVSACVISFLDLYEKTKRNFPDGHAVSPDEQRLLVRQFVQIGAKYGISIRTCCENPSLALQGADVSGCMTQAVLESAIGCRLRVPKSRKSPRTQCNCLLGADIGMYNTCPHGCVYCYANADRAAVVAQCRQHDPASPFLIGGFRSGDTIVPVHQESYIDPQLSFL